MEGGLYQWHTAMGFAKTCGDGAISCSSQISSGNHQGICPNGWHIPKFKEWEELHDYLDSYTSVQMRDSSFGEIQENGLSNRSGFSAIAAGARTYNGGFGNHGWATYFWEVEEGSSISGYFRSLYDTHAESNRAEAYKRVGVSVRCLMD